MAFTRSTNPVKALWQGTRSLRLTIALFLLLAGASVLGTLIPQNLAPEEYSRIYGVVATRLLQTLQVTDLYHSPWFMGMMGLLVLNLIACSVHRFPGAWKTIHTPQRPLTDRLWQSLPIRRSLEGKTSPEDAFRWISEELNRRRWSWREERSEEAIHVLAQRGRYGRMGVYVTHVGVVVILLGAVVGFAFGFKGFVQIPQGETVDRVQDKHGSGWRALGFQVRCDEFRMATYPDGTPKEYRSDLSFMENGKVALQAPVRVNHPLQFGGYVFYQSSYGTSAQITLDVRSESGGEPRQVSLGLGETRPLDPQGRELVRALRYESDFQGRGPAVFLAHMRTPGQPTAGWVFKDGGGSRVEGRVVRLLDAKESRWTGLQVKRDPGVWIVWIGCALVMLGCAMAFLLSHRRLWIRIQAEGGRTRCRVGASADKGKSTMELWTEGLCAAWAKGVALNVDDRGNGNE